ncbi:MAG: hypothetical protein P4L66_00795 [Acetobacteraceae bacterium]|nr:hypothetical protein [Acetobacteraceae bacterium]
MLGKILCSLTTEAAAEEALAALGDAGLLARVRMEAASHNVTPGAFAAAAIRHLLDSAGEETWLDLIGCMSRSPQPGVAALTVILGHAFPVENVARAG